MAWTPTRLSPRHHTTSTQERTPTKSRKAFWIYDQRLPKAPLHAHNWMYRVMPFTSYRWWAFQTWDPLTSHGQWTAQCRTYTAKEEGHSTWRYPFFSYGREGSRTLHGSSLSHYHATCIPPTTTRNNWRTQNGWFNYNIHVPLQNDFIVREYSKTGACPWNVCSTRQGCTYCIACAHTLEYSSKTSRKCAKLLEAKITLNLCHRYTGQQRRETAATYVHVWGYRHNTLQLWGQRSQWRNGIGRERGKSRGRMGGLDQGRDGATMSTHALISIIMQHTLTRLSPSVLPLLGRGPEHLLLPFYDPLHSRVA